MSNNHSVNTQSFVPHIIKQMCWTDMDKYTYQLPPIAGYDVDVSLPNHVIHQPYLVSK